MKHPSQLGFIYKCRLYANAHGYYGMPGGWIYREGAPIRGRKHKYSSKPVCHGWEAFYKMFGRHIERWLLHRYEEDKRNDRNIH